MEDSVPFTEEKKYRQQRAGSPINSLFGLVRSGVYSRAENSQRESYFETYKRLYGGH
jgi:hypothetical protein